MFMMLFFLFTANAMPALTNAFDNPVEVQIDEPTLLKTPLLQLFQKFAIAAPDDHPLNIWNMMMQTLIAKNFDYATNDFISELLNKVTELNLQFVEMSIADTLYLLIYIIKDDSSMTGDFQSLPSLSQMAQKDQHFFVTWKSIIDGRVNYLKSGMRKFIEQSLLDYSKSYLEIDRVRNYPIPALFSSWVFRVDDDLQLAWTLLFTELNEEVGNHEIVEMSLMFELALIRVKGDDIIRKGNDNDDVATKLKDLFRYNDWNYTLDSLLLSGDKLAEFRSKLLRLCQKRALTHTILEPTVHYHGVECIIS
eukprot:NODE_83_length_22457_cov_0.375794.p1 type:complete len:307 gc:universal NODE_83_length_22457_cov_0.375794:2429-1509(-)